MNLTNATNFVRAVGLLIPLLTALVTKQVASAGLKSIVTTVLATITSAIALLVTSSGDWDWQAFINGFLNAFVPAIAVYYGLWKPTGVAGSVSGATERFGVGRPVAETSGKGLESPPSAAKNPDAPNV